MRARTSRRVPLALKLQRDSLVFVLWVRMQDLGQAEREARWQKVMAQFHDALTKAKELLKKYDEKDRTAR